MVYLLSMVMFIILELLQLSEYSVYSGVMTTSGVYIISCSQDELDTITRVTRSCWI